MFFMYLMGETPRRNPVNMDQRNNIKKSWWQKLMVLFFSTSPLEPDLPSGISFWDLEVREKICVLWYLGADALVDLRPN